VRSLVEWGLAIAVLAGAIWLGAPWVARWMPRPRAAPAAEVEPAPTPAGVPAGTHSVPLLVLLDGAEVRVGQPETGLRAILSDRLAAGPRVISRGTFGERVTRAYLAQGTRFWVVLERPQPGDQVRVTGIYLQ
jgi:hypothetical protein